VSPLQSALTISRSFITFRRKGLTAIAP
jgi:hypothetical protein